MSDRIAVMSGGRILQIAAPRTLYEAPNCREVADFIGQMNFFAARITGRDGESARVNLGPLGQMSLKIRQDGDVLIALRPEKIAMSTQQSADSVAGRVVAAAYLGERTHYTVAVEGLREPIFVADQNAQIAARASVPGDAVHLSWSADDLVVLPAE